jgi:hypothetical protein
LKVIEFSELGERLSFSIPHQHKSLESHLGQTASSVNSAMPVLPGGKGMVRTDKEECPKLGTVLKGHGHPIALSKLIVRCRTKKGQRQGICGRFGNDPARNDMSDSHLTRKEAERELERLEYQLSRLQDSDKNSERKAELVSEIERLRELIKRSS